MVASVPEFANRTFSIPNRLHKRSAPSREIGEGVTKRVPPSSAALVSAITSSFKWPASIAPKPIERSSSCRPSTSVIQAPLAETMLIGYGSQYWKLEVTPIGEESFAIVLSTPEAKVDFENNAHSAAIISLIFSEETGVTTFGVLRKVCGSRVQVILERSTFCWMAR